jgi:hypothetical protein
MRTGFLISFVSLCLSTTASANVCGLGFTAPAINSSSNVANPIVGDIIYDQGAAGFYGYNQAGSWIALGPDINNSTLATLSNSTGVAVHGTNTNDNASAGYVGELVSNNPSSAVTPGSSGTIVDVATITLSAGDWDVEGFLALATGSTWSGSQWGVQVSTTSAGSDSTTDGGINWYTGSVAASGTFYVPTGRRRLSLNGASTSVYLTAQLTYSTLGSTTFATSSYIRARRVR